MNRQIGSVTLPFKQRGIASLIVVLLVGLEVLALSAATLYNVHGTQERQIAAHAQVNSQVAAWTAVENTRLYLSSLDQAGINALAAGALATGNANVAIEITNVTNAPTPNTKRVTALVTATATAGEAASRVQVVYDVSAGAAPSTTTLTGSMLKGTTTIAGGMDFTGATGAGLDFFVEGNLDFGGTGIEGGGLRKLVVTGNLTAGSAIKAETVVTNGTVSLTGGAGIKYIYAMKDVTLESGVSGVETIRSDGNVTIKMASPVSQADALGTMTVTGWGHHGTLTSKGDMTLGGSSNGGSASKAQTQGNLTQGNPSTAFTSSTLLANGNVTCSGNAKDKIFDKIETGGTASELCKSAIAIKPNTSPNVQVLPPQIPFTTPSPSVDVWALKSQANYVYEFIDNKMMVTVSNISGLSDGQYLVNKSSQWQDTGYVYVCTDKTGSCTTPEGPNPQKHYINNQRYAEFDYNEYTKTWKIVGGNTAPGVSWFKGNLSVEGGVHFNTYLATGDMTVSNAVVIAPNVAGDAGLCHFAGIRFNRDDSPIQNNTPTASQKTTADNTATNAALPAAKKLRGVPSARSDNTVDPVIDGKYSPSDYSNLLPKNFCDTSATPATQVIDGVTYKRLKPNSIGNIAIAAGGIDPSASTPKYSGGKIYLNSGVPYGNVLAGEQLRTVGSSRIYGNFIAADLALEQDAKNDFNAKLVIDLSVLGVDFNAGEIPNMNNTTTPPTATMVWSQYP